MEVNYSDKELENFDSKRSNQSAGGKNPPLPQKINNFQGSISQSRPQATPKSTPQQMPKKEISPPPNIPTVPPPGMSEFLKPISPQISPQGLKLKFDFSKFLSKKPLIIGASAIVIVATFALIALGFSSSDKGNYKNLESLFLTANQPLSVHSKTEIFIKSTETKKGSFLNNYLLGLTAQIPPPPSPQIPQSKQSDPLKFEFDNSDESWTDQNIDFGSGSGNPFYSPPMVDPSPEIMDFPQDFEFKLTVDSDTKMISDKSGIEKLKAAISFQAKAGPITFSGSAQVIFKNDVLYFKLDSGSPIDMFMPGLSDKWVRVDFKSILKQFAGDDYDRMIAQNLQNNKELQEKIIALFSKAKIQDIFTIHKSKTEKINNIDSYYYELSFKKEFLSGAIMDAFRILSEETAKQMTGINISVDPGAFINEFKNEQEEIKQAADFISQIPFELWIGKKDNLVYKFKVDIGKITAKIAPLLDEEMPAIEGYMLTEYSNYGKDFEVEEPTRYENIETILQSMGIGSLVGDDNSLADKKTRNNRRIADISSLRLALELYYNDNGRYPKASKWTRLDSANNPFDKTLINKYIANVPLDPMSPDFYYAYKSDGKRYELSARLEYYPEVQKMCDPSTTQICLFIVKNQ